MGVVGGWGSGLSLHSVEQNLRLPAFGSWQKLVKDPENCLTTEDHVWLEAVGLGLQWILHWPIFSV